MPDLHKPTMRVISVLDVIAHNSGKFTLSEISQQLSIPVSTLFPIVRTLRESQYITLDAASQTYSLGLKLFEIGSRFIQDSWGYDHIVEAMKTIVEQCGEATHFAVLDQGNVLYLAKVDSTLPIRMYAAPGRRLPAYGTAVGKALLRDYTRQELEAVYPEGLKPLTANTITSFALLYEQLQKIKTDGFAYEIEESTESVRCIAVPILRGGRVAAALSVAIPVFRYSEEKARLIERALLEAARHVANLVVYMNL